MIATPAQPRSVVVTGVGRSGQLGEAIARGFAQSGARVAIIARSAVHAAARATEMRADGLDVYPFACDLADAAAVAVLAAQIAAEAGRVDVLVNAAGGFGLTGPVAESDPGAFQDQLTIGLVTAYAATRGFLPALRQSRGCVLFIASASALPGARVKGVSGYAAAKAGVITLMRAVAQEEHAAGVRANAVAPAAVRTAANLTAMPADSRYVEPESVVAALRYLCSDSAAQVTGQVSELAP